jgi:hypothetical protein
MTDLEDLLRHTEDEAEAEGWVSRAHHDEHCHGFDLVAQIIPPHPSQLISLAPALAESAAGVRPRHNFS